MTYASSITVRLTPELAAALRAIGDRRDLNLSDVLRDLLWESAAREAQRVSAERDVARALT